MTRRRCLASPVGFPTGLQLFLDFDDRFGLLQLPTKACSLPLGLRQLRRQRVPRRGLGSPLGRRQPTKSSAIALPAPIRQGRRVQTFPAQDRSDPTNVGRAVSLRQNTKLRLRRKSPTPRPIRHLGSRRRRGRHYGRPPASLRTNPGGIVRLLVFVLHDHDGCPSPQG